VFCGTSGFHEASVFLAASGQKYVCNIEKIKVDINIKGFKDKKV